MRIREEHVFFEGPVGPIEVLMEVPASPAGLALICHPHPLFGGANTNKVAQTLARTLAQLGQVSLRPNFRGVGASAGTHDDGIGETDDMLAVLAGAERRFGSLPVVLAGFSFGAYVQSRVAVALAEAGRPARRMILVGTAAGHVEGARRYDLGAIPGDSIVIHGARDETVPLANVLAWAEPMDLPVIVVPGADHFFHRRLHVLRDIVTRAWRD